ncbi:MAG TPA: PDZ domain-containing protein, partial [Candidatus Dormibacteraeota bacterium]|nr:PDZ domain-containing protein [Candidatus Dormibacteraeota bacterium]
MSRVPLWLLACLTLLGAAAPARAARPAPPPAPAPEAPAPPHDHMIFFSSGGSWLGISIADITGERVRELKLKEETGAEVKAVMPGSPAEEAGLKTGDVVLEYQGTRIEGAMQLTRMVRETPPGRTVALKIFHDGETRTVRVKVAEHDGEGRGERFQKVIEIPHIEMPEIDVPEIPLLGGMQSSMRLGVSVENLTDQLREFFGVRNGEGVLVRSVKKGSPAEDAGLRAGDVILKVDGEKVEDSADLRGALRERRGRQFPITIVRDRREQTLTVSLPKGEAPTEESLGPDLEKRIQERVRKTMDAEVRRLQSK